jgi:hypothetical protein
VTLRRAAPAPPEPGAAVHHLDAAAGSRPQARLHRPEDHAHRAAPLRGRGFRRGRHRPDHLHAYRLGVAGRRRHQRDAPRHRQRFGAKALPEKPRFYRTKAKNAQEAHEAIRPTSAAWHPDDLAGRLDRDQQRLYELIWKRAVASQMASAVFDTVSLDLVPSQAPDAGHRFRASGSILVEPGYIAVYQEGRDDAEDEQDRRLPQVEEGELIALNKLDAEQHFTKPPPRFSEASLVKTLEEFGIGRPSTYATIISTLVDREYVELDRKRFIPDRRRPDRQHLPERAFHALRGLRLHGADGRSARCDLARRAESGRNCWGASGNRSRS